MKFRQNDKESKMLQKLDLSIMILYLLFSSNSLKKEVTHMTERVKGDYLCIPLSNINAWATQFQMLIVWCVNNVWISSVPSLDNVFKNLIEPNQYIPRKSQNKMAGKKVGLQCRIWQQYVISDIWVVISIWNDQKNK